MVLQGWWNNYKNINVPAEHATQTLKLKHGKVLAGINVHDTEQSSSKDIKVSPCSWRRK